MNILELEEKSKYEMKDVTARKMAESILVIMKNHIGSQNSISRERLFKKVYGVTQSDLRPLNQYLLKELLYQAITYLRKKSHCFIVAHMTNKGWEYFVPMTAGDLKVYKRYTAERIKSLEELERRAERSVKEKWYQQEWKL